MSSVLEIEAMLVELIQASVTLSDDEKNEIQHFLDYGQYDLALETAVGVYLEEKKTPSPTVIQLVERLAIAMDMDPAPLLRDLKSQL